MERGSVIDAHFEYLSEVPFRKRFMRMVIHKVYTSRSILTDHERNKTEDELNNKLNAMDDLKLIDNLYQREVPFIDAATLHRQRRMWDPDYGVYIPRPCREHV